jgi:hypothetical protein
MPAVPFETLPDDARLWVFASSAPLAGGGAERLLAAVDDFIDGWAAHGTPLRAARDWRDDRFLAVAVDQSAAGASGCSIDGLFRSLRALEPALGTSLVGAGRVFWRDAAGHVQVGDRARFAAAAAAGDVTADTAVFDPSVTTAEAWRSRFEVPAGQSWHRALLRQGAASER